MSSLLAGSLGLLGLTQTVAKKKGRAEGKKQVIAEAEACIPTGKCSASPEPRGKRGENWMKATSLSSTRCCQHRTSRHAQGHAVCSCAPDNTPCTENSECCLGVCSGGLCGSGATAALPTGPVVLLPPCNFPLRRDLATQGGGTAGTNQCAVSEGCQQTVQISLQGSTAKSGFDVYIDQENRGNFAHKFAGTFTPEAAGNAFFQNTLIVPGACPSVVDNEPVRQGARFEEFGNHQFIQENFTPCPFC